MFLQLSRNWWCLALRGVTIILFGMLALAWRGDTLGSFMPLFGGFALVNSLFAIFVALTKVFGNKRRWIILHGLVSIDIALFTFFWTESAATILLYLVAAWALITGILELVAAWEVRQNVSNEVLLILSGMASIVFGWLIVRYPIRSTDVFGMSGMIAAFAIIFGLLTLAASLNIRSLGKYVRLVIRP